MLLGDPTKALSVLGWNPTKTPFPKVRPGAQLHFRTRACHGNGPRSFAILRRRSAMHFRSRARFACLCLGGVNAWVSCLLIGVVVLHGCCCPICMLVCAWVFRDLIADGATRAVGGGDGGRGHQADRAQRARGHPPLQHHVGAPPDATGLETAIVWTGGGFWSSTLPAPPLAL